MKSIMLLIPLLAGNAAQGQSPLIDLKAIDTSIDPCQDFYQYSCGQWLKDFKPPGDRPSYNRQTDDLAEATVKNLNALVDQFSKGQNLQMAHYADKVGQYYASCMDTAKIEVTTPSFVKQVFFDFIDKAQTRGDLSRIVAILQLQGVNAFFRFGSGPDLSDSDSTIGQIDQGGMSFQDKGYYFNTDAQSLEIRDRFLNHVANIFQISGDTVAAAKVKAQVVLDMETQLANNALAVEDMQDSTKLNHPSDVGGLKNMSPDFDWINYFQNLGLPIPGKINVSNPEFVRAFGTLFGQGFKFQDIKTYLKWQSLHAYASSLSKVYVDENFSFWGAYLQGQAQQKVRWKQCTDSVKGNLTEALGEAYVNTFTNSKQLKDQAETMIVQIKSAFGYNLDQLPWLDAQTRTAAKNKLSMVGDKVGFPDQWQDYHSLALNDNFSENVVAVSVFESMVDLAKVGKPTNRKLWSMGAWEQNAYYEPSSNTMNFPLGALVPPIFDLNFSTGANFGSIGGGWMGHELSHGFDSDGRHYDGKGNLVNWWTDQTTQEFAVRTQCLVDQANKYQVLPGVTVNGKQTLTENLADQGGVKVGYLAYKTATAAQKPAPSVGYYNEDQQYWLAYAQSWCTKQTPESTKLQVATNVHPPAEFRANAVLFNRPEFASAFGCRVGTRMAPVTRCSVW